MIIPSSDMKILRKKNNGIRDLVHIHYLHILFNYKLTLIQKRLSLINFLIYEYMNKYCNRKW